MPIACSSQDANLPSCAICWESLPEDAFWKVQECPESHSHCRDCMRHHYISQIEAAEPISCPFPQCRASPSDREVKALVPAAIFQKYLNLLVIAIVRNNPDYRWCPIPICSRAVKIDPSAPSVTCPNCGFTFCHNCSLPAHGASPCQFILTETQKEVAKWCLEVGSSAVKACPSCNMLTEKNDGCNHMTCRSCQGQWCWLCRCTYGPSHYGPGMRCEGLQFAPYNTVKEARWAQHGKEGWRARRKAKGEKLGTRMYKDLADPLAIVADKLEQAGRDAAFGVWQEKNKARLEKERQRQAFLLQAQRDVEERMKKAAIDRGTKGVITSVPPPIVKRSRSVNQARARQPPKNRTTIFHPV